MKVVVNIIEFYSDLIFFESGSSISFILMDLVLKYSKVIYYIFFFFIEF